MAMSSVCLPPDSATRSGCAATLRSTPGRRQGLLGDVEHGVHHGPQVRGVLVHALAGRVEHAALTACTARRLGHCGTPDDSTDARMARALALRVELITQRTCRCPRVVEGGTRSLLIRGVSGRAVISAMAGGRSDSNPDLSAETATPSAATQPADADANGIRHGDQS